MSNLEIFATMLLLAPALFALLHEWVRARRWGRGVRVAFDGATFASVSLYAALLMGWPPGLAARWSVQPLRGPFSPEEMLRLLLFAIWLGLAMRLLVVAREEGKRTPALSGAPRSATLTSRAGANPVSAGSWHFAWGIWASGTVATLILALTVDAAVTTRPWAGATLLLVLGLALVSLGPVVARASLREAEPLDRDGSRELADAYAVHRNAQVVGCYWLTLGLVAWMSLEAVLAVSTAGPSGAIKTFSELATFGIAIGGAAFGIQMIGVRGRIRRILDG